MAFKIYNTFNTTHEASPRWNGPETLNMTHYGHFSLSQKVRRRLGLSDGSRIELLQDEQYPSDWYIRKTSAKEGFQLTPSKEGYAIRTTGWKVRKTTGKGGKA